MIPVRHFHRIAWVAVILAFGVIFLGGFTRLNNAGLSCPDWPTCYGKVTWPTTEADIAHANANFERAVEVSKAVWEQVHRHMAATLGTLVLVLALLAVRRKPQGVATVAVGAALVNPVAGAATLIASSVISNPLNRLFSYRYHVTGSWADPKVDSSGVLPVPAVEVPEEAVAPAKQNEE